MSLPLKHTPSVKAAEIAPTGVRLPPELRAALVREATINGRSLSQEITQRLQASFGEPAPSSEPASTRPAREGAAAYLKQAVDQANPAVGLTDHQRMLLAQFDAMSPDKQLALLTVLRR